MARLGALALAWLLLSANVAPNTTRRTPVVQAVERVSRAVVAVSVEVVVSYQNPFDGFFRDFSGPTRQKETASQGSGVVIDASGLVLTNYHVIQVGGDIRVELTDGRRLEAKVVGSAPDHDLAVLKLESAATVPHIPMGTSGDLMIGETVIAIGNPFGLSHTVTTGVVSALHRSITTEQRTYSDFIQTDASINPGNSGGPLLNIEGELVGINTAIYGKAQGIGFAIPIDKARRIVSDLVRYGEVRRPYFGFEAQDLTPELAKTFGVLPRSGVVVAEVDPKGPARGVLEEGDIVTRVEAQPVDSAQQLRLRLGEFTADSPVVLDVTRNGAAHPTKVLAAALSPSDALRRLRAKTGIEVVELDAAEARRLRLPAGVIVVDTVGAGSPAHRLGLRAGDWVRAVDSEKVTGMDGFAKAMARSYWRGQVTLLVQRGRAWQQIAFDL
jgi:serine protease Do